MALLSKLKGSTAPKDWQGIEALVLTTEHGRRNAVDIERSYFLTILRSPTLIPFSGGLNITYKLGPGLENDLKTTITINGYFEVK